MRTSKQQVAVAAALMQNPNGKHWGYELGRSADVRSGVMYPILRRWFEAGWLEDGWEDPASISGRPPRRYYTITETGARELGALLACQPVQSLAMGRLAGGMG